MTHPRSKFKHSYVELKYVISIHLCFPSAGACDVRCVTQTKLSVT